MNFKKKFIYLLVLRFLFFRKMKPLFSVWVYLALTTSALPFDNIISPSCSPEAEICEFTLDLNYNWTMMGYPEGNSMQPVVIKENGEFHIKRKQCDGTEKMSAERNYIKHFS